MQDPQAKSSITKPGPSPVFIAGLMLLVATYGIVLIPVRAGKTPSPLAALAALLTTIAFFSFLWKQRARRWWVGAMTGTGIAIVALSLLTLLSRFASYDALEFGLDVGAAKENLSLPRQIDSITRLDRAVVGPGHRVTYLMTITSMTSSNVPKEFVSSMETRVTSNACGGALKPLLDNDITVAYEYHAIDGPQIAKFELTRALCEQKRH